MTATAEAIRSPRIAIVSADNPARVELVRELFKEYAASLSFNLCFQSFEQELASLPGEYGPWSGMLLLGLVDQQPAGCVALHRLDEKTSEDDEIVSEIDLCEMKRLFVRPQFRGCGLGSNLVKAILKCAAAIGYRRMRLDTVPSEMGMALEMYRRIGFVEIAPYRENPIPGAKYLELNLKLWQAKATGEQRIFLDNVS